MVRIELIYEGNLRCQATHEPSGQRLSTDAPKDNQGLGQAFSPTDLVATGLGTCVATTMSIRTRAKGWLLDGTTVRVDKHMTTEAPRRIARLEVTVRVPSAVSVTLEAEDRALLEDIAHTCPVRLSLLPAIEVPIDFHWG